MSLILVISGPAGVGKTTICNRLLDEFSNQLTRVVTTTTRKSRKGERHGEDYYFTVLKNSSHWLKKMSFSSMRDLGIMEQAGGQFVIRLKKPRMSLLTSMLQEQNLKHRDY